MASSQGGWEERGGGSAPSEAFLEPPLNGLLILTKGDLKRY